MYRERAARRALVLVLALIQVYACAALTARQQCSEAHPLAAPSYAGLDAFSDLSTASHRSLLQEGGNARRTLQQTPPTAAPTTAAPTTPPDWLGRGLEGLWEWTNCVKSGACTDLDLSLTGLAGTIPTTIGLLTTLTKLSLSASAITGTIPTELGLLTLVEHFDLSSNEFTGTLPTELANLLDTDDFPPVFNLGGNSLRGSIPTELFSMEPATSSDLDLDLSDNRFDGPIPTELGNVQKFLKVKLNGNYLVGSIPTEFGRLTDLTEVLLHDNRLVGSLPLTALPNTQLADAALTTVHDNERVCGDVPVFTTGVLDTTNTLLGAACPVQLVCCSVAYEWHTFCCLAKNLGTATAEKFCDPHC